MAEAEANVRTSGFRTTRLSVRSCVGRGSWTLARSYNIPPFHAIVIHLSSTVTALTSPSTTASLYQPLGRRNGNCLESLFLHITYQALSDHDLVQSLLHIILSPSSPRTTVTPRAAATPPRGLRAVCGR
ncbi:hypothetical protein J6590_030042 [Homalodisca vitripennis]|nr:hypothetical protein J6590_030042 [Homalodisca vitripennis]